MTTIAYDGSTIASDSLAISGNTALQESARKIEKYSPEATYMGQTYTAAGGAGRWSAIEKFIRLVEMGGGEYPAQEHGDEYTCFFAITSDGELHVYEDGEITERTRTHRAFGSGREFAMGAMLAGKSAKEAVEIACKLDPYSGGEVVVHPTGPWTILNNAIRNGKRESTELAT